MPGRPQYRLQLNTRNLLLLLVACNTGATVDQAEWMLGFVAGWLDEHHEREAQDR